jgi:hypothetical protein
MCGVVRYAYLFTAPFHLQWDETRLEFVHVE